MYVLDIVLVKFIIVNLETVYATYKAKFSVKKVRKYLTYLCEYYVHYAVSCLSVTSVLV